MAPQQRRTARTRSKEFTLEIPLDASQVKDFKPEQDLKVVIQAQDGSVTSRPASLGAKAQGSISVGFAKQPGRLRVVIGPAQATDEELLNSQTIGLDVPSRIWLKGREVTLAPIRISSYYWYWWLRWCQTYTIRGQVVCADGSPVPGAQVCAYDVDWWFFWSSTQLVGCATTDINGAFELDFRWCCGWWPWWWWRYRSWQLDDILLERVGSVLERDPRLRLKRTTNQPSLEVFSDILGPEHGGLKRGLEAADVKNLDQIRHQLLEKLPQAPELERLRIWPWYPWWPWWDCTPDIIFKVTQDCRVPGAVIVDEGVGDTRWNVSDPLEVTLVANDQACCRRPDCDDPPCEDGECLVIVNVCGDAIDDIGGNLGAPAAPEGYLYPGAVAPGSADYNGDRPYGGAVNVYKNSGDMLGVDYYEVEFFDGVSWSPVPPGAAVSFSREWLFYDTGTDTWSSGSQPFPFATMTGHTVVESREHFENTGPYSDWWPGGFRFWTTNEFLLFPLDSSKFADGTYHFRVVGWELGAGGDLENPQVIPLCGSGDDNELVLTLDNRVIDGPGHDPSHNCGPIHTCTLEPDTHFLGVRIDGQPVDPCDTVDAAAGLLEIDFKAHDPDGHLALYSLQATFGLNEVVNLLDPALGAVVTPLVPGTSVGPTYGQALGQGALAPSWSGGDYTLTIPAANAFPRPCCYQLELRAWKRTVVGCSHGYEHRNLSEYTLGVGVCPPNGTRGEGLVRAARM